MDEMRKRAELIRGLIRKSRIGPLAVSNGQAEDLAIVADHIDPTDEQLALDAGKFVVEFFGQAGDAVALDDAVARAAYLHEHRITHSSLAWDRVILGYFAGRLGADWAKEDS